MNQEQALEQEDNVIERQQYIEYGSSLRLVHMPRDLNTTNGEGGTTGSISGGGGDVGFLRRGSERLSGRHNDLNVGTGGNGFRHTSDRYDVTGTMNRLRSSLMGDMSEGTKWSLYGSTSITAHVSGGTRSANSPSPYSLTPVLSCENVLEEDVRDTMKVNRGNYDLRKNKNSMNSTNNDEFIEDALLGRNGCSGEDTTDIPNRCSGKDTPKFLSPSNSLYRMVCLSLKKGLYQIPAIVLIGMFHLMVGIPFGVSYFPVSWRSARTAFPVTKMHNGVLMSNGTDYLFNSSSSTTTTSFSVETDAVGTFPLPGKEALGIRMFLFATVIGQVAFTLVSGFDNPIGLQMVENVPFCHELSQIAIFHQGYSADALSTLFVMFGLSSIIVGIVFYVLGRFKLGSVVYYFPKHVLVGCIGGIGIFIAKTGIEVTMDSVFTMPTVIGKFHLLSVVIVFELILRILERTTRDSSGHARYPLLSPIYFCSITPMFYAALWILNFNVNDAMEAGYFFPHLDSPECVESMDTPDCPSSSIIGSIFNEHLLDMWNIINLPTVSMAAIFDAIPTMTALILFSLIHVPINIPAFAISSNAEVDMNRELISHGYSNLISGMFGGLQNYMAYTQSVVYHKSGGKGKTSGMAVALLTSILFFVGPMIASYIPRCMAGCLLLHVGMDLFLEGVYDSYGQFDFLEYAGIWLITIVMTLYGMEASMVAGFVAALSTYAVQNTAYVNPIRGSMSAATLRSSHFQRSPKANEILSDSYLGRSRILVIQLQGHLFFGNMTNLSDSINSIVFEKYTAGTGPSIVVLDFSLVLGIDSSAAQAIGKVRNTIRKKYNVTLCIFVTGSSEGFPTHYNLTKELSSTDPIIQDYDILNDVSNEFTGLLNPPKVPMPVSYTGSRVFASLDEALVFAENALLAWQDPTLLEVERAGLRGCLDEKSLSIQEEHEIAKYNLERLAPNGTDKAVLDSLFNALERETYIHGEYLWKQGSPSTCAKLLVRGQLMAILEDEAGTSEKISYGNLLGELGLVEGIPRMSTVVTISEEAVLYSLHRTSYDRLCMECPSAARIIDLVCIKYLSARVQHVSNRIFETRCLPI